MKNTHELTAQEAATLITKLSGYPISPTQVRNLCAKGQIQGARKHGNIWAIDPTKVENFKRKRPGASKKLL